MAYENLSDEEKVIEAIGFVARGAVMPTVLKEFLESINLYELIANPVESMNAVRSGENPKGIH